MKVEVTERRKVALFLIKSKVLWFVKTNLFLVIINTLFKVT